MDAVAQAVAVAPGGDTIAVTRQQFTASGFATGGFEEVGFRQNVSATGNIALPPEAMVDVSSVSGGVVSGLKLIEGETVRKGQTLFTVTSTELLGLQRELLELRARLVALRAEERRQEALDSANVSARKYLIEARANVRTAEVLAAGIEGQLRAFGVSPGRVNNAGLVERLTVTAPRAGQVAAVRAANGQRLAPGEAALAIVSTDELHLELRVLERDITLMRAGQEVRFTVANDAAVRRAEVHLIAPTVDSLRRALVHCDVTRASGEGLLGGMYVQAEIIVDERRQASLPDAAIVEQEGTPLALVQVDPAGTRFVPRKVERGLSQDGRTAILNAGEFAPGTKFLTEGAFTYSASSRARTWVTTTDKPRVNLRSAVSRSTHANRSTSGITIRCRLRGGHSTVQVLDTSAAASASPSTRKRWLSLPPRCCTGASGTVLALRRGRTRLFAHSRRAAVSKSSPGSTRPFGSVHAPSSLRAK